MRIGWRLGWLWLGVLQAEEVVLTSPDETNAITFRLAEDGTASYQVSRNHEEIILSSPLGIRTTQGSFTAQLSLQKVSPVEEAWQNYELLTGPVTQVRTLCRFQDIHLRNAKEQPLILELAASNQGVAFRYRLPGSGEVILEEEKSGFRLADEARGWMSPYNRSTNESPAYEDYFFAVKPGDPPPSSRGGPTRGWYLPAFWQWPHAALLIMETGATSSGSHLEWEENGYQFHHPFADETTAGVDLPDDGRPRYQRPATLPWRALALADSPADLATNTWGTDLAEPCQLEDSSWIRPGRASWSWWAFPENQSREERTATYLAYIRMAAEMGWEYSLLDAGWWDSDLETVREAARKAGVGLMAWTHAQDFYDENRRRRKLDELKNKGFVGVKIDFWSSDKQATHEAILATLQEAAKRQLVVNLHGCTVPRGWQRTYPNLLTGEAVLGAESYMFDDRFPELSAQQNTVLPFTRNVMAPMDYTPLGLASKRYARKNTAAHELAAALIFHSGIVHYALSPERLDTLPPSVQSLLRDAPAQWNETRCLKAEPGEAVLFVKRKGTSWYLLGLNGSSQEHEFHLDLQDYHKHTHRTLFRQGSPEKDAIRSEQIPADSQAHTLTLTLATRDGFVLRMNE